MRHKWKHLIFQDFNNFWGVGLKVLISTSLQNYLKSILSMLKTFRVWLSLLGNFWLRLFSCLGYLSTIWKRRGIGKIGQRKLFKTTLLLNWEDLRKIPRKLSRKEKTKEIKRILNLLSGSIQLLSSRHSLVLSTVESK